MGRSPLLSPLLHGNVPTMTGSASFFINELSWNCISGLRPGLCPECGAWWWGPEGTIPGS